jgi:hypothetical protein
MLHEKIRNIKFKKIFSLYNIFLIILISYVVFYNYFFFAPIILIFLILFGFDTKVSRVERYIYQCLVIIFYIKKFIFGFTFDNFNLWKESFYSSYEPYLPDLILVLEQINCNYLISNIKSNNNECSAVDGYGPLLYYLNLPLNIEIVVEFYIYVLLLGMILFSRYIFSKYENYSHLLTITLLSPTLNLLLHQMNIDFFFLLIALYCMRNIERKTLLKSFLILFISLLKLHPVGIIFGLIIYGLIKKNKKILIVNLISFLVFISSLILFLISQNSLLTSPRPSGMENSIGFLSLSQYLWINYIKITGQYRDVLIIYILLFSVFFAIIIRYKNKDYFKNIDISTYELLTIFWLITSYLYANYDYRSAFLIPILIIYFQSERKKEYTAILLFLVVSPINPIFSVQLINLLIIIKVALFFRIFYFFTLILLGFIKNNK